MARIKNNSRQLFKTGFSDNKKLIKLTDTQLDDLKRILLEMLSDFIRVADEYSLQYTMSGGSVLGAVRHQGFIPWDDDVDVNLPRKDYDRFLNIFDKELGDKYLLCSPERTHDHGMLCAQIKKKNTLYRSFNELSKEREECGICLDIFVIENTFDFVFARWMQGVISLGAGYLSTCRKTYHDMSYIQKYLEKDSVLERTFLKKARIGHLFSRISLDKVTRLAAKCYALCRNEKSRYVTIPSGREHFFGELQIREDLCQRVDAQFENLVVKIPKNSDKYLCSLYGKDYMKLPPVEKREAHPIMELDMGIQIQDIQNHG